MSSPVLRIRSRLRQEQGQVLALMAVAMVALLGMVAFVVDVGRLYYAHRAIQASADAAATAGAQALPDPNAAIALARQYSAEPGNKNAMANLGNVTATYTTKCISGIPCNPANTIVVNESSQVDSIFAKIFGFGSWTVTAKATAAMSGGTPLPLDIMIVLDRTGSMCQPCSKIDNAKEGIREFLGAMYPSSDKIGLTVLPPATSIGNRCNTSPSGNYDNSSYPYAIVPMVNDFRTSDTGPLNYSSNLLTTLECLSTGGITSYATSITRAQAAIDAEGRANAQDVIIFFTDGEANYGPWYYGNSSGERRTPCHQAISNAGTVKARGTWVYTIAYDTPASVRCLGYRNVSGCRQGAAQQFQCDEQSIITAYSTLQQMATDSTKFYYQPNPGDLTAIFERVAQDLSGIRLIDDDAT